MDAATRTLKRIGSLALATLAAVVVGWVLVLLIVGAYSNFTDRQQGSVGYAVLGLSLALIPPLAGVLTYDKARRNGFSRDHLIFRVALALIGASVIVLVLALVPWP